MKYQTVFLLGFACMFIAIGGAIGSLYGHGLLGAAIAAGILVAPLLFWIIVFGSFIYVLTKLLKS